MFSFARPRNVARNVICSTALIFALCLSAAAQERGQVTNLPIPRFVSVKSSEANVRRGPSLSHRIDWVFKRKDLPVEITAEHGHWRRIRDRDGAGGWVHYTLLSGARTCIVDQDMLQLHSRASETAPIAALLEIGVVARIEECSLDWCKLQAGGYRGWAPKQSIWGVRADEILE